MDTLCQLVDNPLFESICTEVLSKQDPKLTKQLLLISRHMGLAKGWGNFRDLTHECTQALMSMPILSRYEEDVHLPTDSQTRIEHILNQFFDEPFYAGAVIMACFINPLSKDQVASIRMESFMKEILVMDSDAYQPNINFNPFFGKYHESLHPDIPSNPEMARIVHQSIKTWIERITARTHTPTMSRKCLPSFTRRELHQYIDYLLEDPSIATPASLERLYVKTGIHIDGPCEISQRWYTNGLVPRTYFVAGPTAYNDTKYTKWLWNDLVDCLACTHRKNRVNPRRIYVDGLKTAIFYDLTSFTSNMGLQRVFLDQLALYCHGVQVTLMDSVIGPHSVDAGDLIKQYNTMNQFPEYRNDELFDMHNGVHGVGGFLGVFGNIATCTYLHGAILLQLAEKEHECGCAGDDAVICVEDEDRVYACISLLGVLAVEKTYDLRDLDVVYLKRRTWLSPKYFCLQSARYIQFPSFIWAIDFTGEFRFTREASLTRRDKMDIAASSLMATFSSMASLKFKAETRALLLSFLEKYYQKCTMPVYGSVPQLNQVKNDYTRRFVPTLDTLGSRDFIALTIDQLYDGVAYLPDREYHDTYGINCRKDTFFRSQGSEYLTFLERLGYVQKRHKPTRTYIGEEGLQLLQKEFTTRDPAWHVFEVVEDIPEWIRGGVLEVTGIYEVEWSGIYHNSE
jgi:hypothetical protein